LHDTLEALALATLPEELHSELRAGALRGIRLAPDLPSICNTLLL
jgi:hypothetical protein